MVAGEHGVCTVAAPGPAGAESGFGSAAVTTQPNGGRTCFGNSYEFQLCNQEECPPLTDFREDQCKVWNPFFEHEGIKHHWLPYEHPDPDERCRLYCQSKETAAVVSMNRMVHDGTACSYSDANSVCVRGECEHVGCDGQIASDQQEDRCGVCGGDNSSCKIIKGNFTRSTKKPGYLKILEIPKGARHLLIQEFKGSPHILAMKNQETGHHFLNHEDELPESRILIEKGVVWKYSNTEELESIQTTGPLKYGVLLMVRSNIDSKVTVSYKYIIQDHLRSSLESNLVQEDAIFYEWALKKWSHCSKPCGGGKQYTRFSCRRKADGKMVHRMFCSNINKPRAISRTCNSNTCSSPHWVTGEWEDCSASCGQTGWRRRWVSCQQVSGSEEVAQRQQQRSVNSKLCTEDRPEGKQTCNRFPCPAAWRAGPWTPCSVSCGNGTQERQVACSSPEGLAKNCSEPQPVKTRLCQAPPCRGDQKSSIVKWLSRNNTNFTAPKISSRQRCRGDRSVFCRMEVLSRYCSNPGYQQMCCKSCSEINSNKTSNTSNTSNFSPTNPPTASSRTLTTEVTTSAATSSWTHSSSVISDIISSLPPGITMTPPPTVRSSTEFTYVDYSDYDDYSQYEDPFISSGSEEILPNTTSTSVTTTPPPPPSTPPPATTTTTTTTTMTTMTITTSTTTNPMTMRAPRRTAPPHIFTHYFRRKSTTPTANTTLSNVTMTTVTPLPVTTRRPRRTAPPHLFTQYFRKKTPTVPYSTAPSLAPIGTSAVPEFPTTADDIITATSLNRTTGGRSLQTELYHSQTEPTSSPSFIPLSKKEKNSVDEVPYRIVGLESDISRGQQSYFVPQMPPIRERTQNKRIQQLLNERRRQDLVRKSSKSRDGRTNGRRRRL